MTHPLSRILELERRVAALEARHAPPQPQVVPSDAVNPGVVDFHPLGPVDKTGPSWLASYPPSADEPLPRPGEESA